MNSRGTLLLAAACGLLASLAVAQTTAPQAAPAGAQAALPSPAPAPAPPSRWTPAQIREAFQLADANSDGQLTRGEAQRLAIMPRSFEDTDLNKDGVLTLNEYMASFGGQ
jgi:hypothetical protein